MTMPDLTPRERLIAESLEHLAAFVSAHVSYPDEAVIAHSGKRVVLPDRGAMEGDVQAVFGVDEENGKE